MNKLFTKDLQIKLFCYILCLRSLCKLFFYGLLQHRVAPVMNNENDSKESSASKPESFFDSAETDFSAFDLDDVRLFSRLRNRRFCCHKYRRRMDLQSFLRFGCATGFRLVYRILRLRCLLSWNAVSGNILFWIYMHSGRLFVEGISFDERIYRLCTKRRSARSGASLYLAASSRCLSASGDDDFGAALYVLVRSTAPMPGGRVCRAGSGCAPRAWGDFGFAFSGFRCEDLFCSLCTESDLIQS